MRNKELFRGRRKAGRLVGLVLTLALAVSLLSGCGQSKERLTFGTAVRRERIIPTVVCWPSILPIIQM